MSKIYFASDMHLGFPNHETSLKREKIIVQWLDSIKDTADQIYLVGDIFDFWWEYKNVVPRGFTRFLGKIAEIVDNGTPVYFFTGNHDLWVTNYLSNELGVKIYRKPQSIIIDNKKFFIGHGDGLGKGDTGYKLLKSVFENKTLQWLFSRIHPNTAIGLGYRWSKRNRYAKGVKADDLNLDKELLVQFVKDHQKNNFHDYYIFGHRHIPMQITIDNAEYVNLGDWITRFTYAKWSDNKLELKKYSKPENTNAQLKS